MVSYLFEYATLYAIYNDGAGNDCTYLFELVNVTTRAVDALTILDSRHYRHKKIMLQPPKAAVTLTSASRISVTGAPPATIDITVKSDGEITWPTHLTFSKVDVQIKLSDWVDELNQLEEQQECTVSAEYYTIGIYQGSTSGTLLVTEAQAEGAVAEALADFDDKLDIVSFRFSNKLSTHLFSIEDLTVVIGAESLLNTNFDTGKMAEQAVQLVLMTSSFSKGEMGPVVGQVAEYMKDGSFGDLDLPLEVLPRRVPA